ncbi:MAG: M20/M25/M40 family metallo-hydrolase [Acidobacteriota bacterium]|jgi:tripeptide aminopeptidase|nr:M20/M25/M40 family metallo-hydrolase [Acidobacteriota bacterium]
MIQRNQLVSEFCELVRINSLSLREKALAELLAAKLIDMGLSVEFDNADKALGGQVGNLIARLPATRFGPTLMLQSHMDTVEPGEGIEPVINGNLVCSAGETILGADAKAGITVILNAVREVIQRGIDHGELQIVFCIAEETGLQGAYHLDYSRISPDFAFVFDGGKPAGRMTTAAPSAYKMTFRMKGLAAHAGVHPERGVSAIQAAASGISRMKLGRIDFETTANIGVIEGGQARNIVPDSCTLLAEARSHDDAKLDAQLAHMVMCLEHAAKEAGATFLEPEVATSYRSFRLADDSPIVQIGWQAAEAIGLEPGTEPGGGGSDANVFNEKGIPSVICATGAQGAHTTTETADIDEMLNSANWLVEIIRRA